MTENTLDILPATMRGQMLKPSTDSWMAVCDGGARQLCEDLCRTDFVPKSFRGNAPAVLGAVLLGRELGMAPVPALQSLYTVDGKIGLYSSTMRALVLSAGHQIRIKQLDANACVIQGKRKGDEAWSEFSFTRQEANAAGLMKKDNWAKYAPDMLLARATARMCKAIFPDVLQGLSAVEELNDVSDAAPAAPATGRVSRRNKTKTKAPEPAPEPEPVIMDAEVVEEPETVEPAEAAKPVSELSQPEALDHFNRLIESKGLKLSEVSGLARDMLGIGDDEPLPPLFALTASQLTTLAEMIETGEDTLV